MLLVWRWRVGLVCSACLIIMDVWTIASSAIAGNGVFALKALPANFEVFRETALVIGPRSDSKCPLVCVSCHQTGLLQKCVENCGLPICAKCTSHAECKIFQKMSNLEIREKMALVAPLRAIFLNPEEKEKLKKLERHDKNNHERILNNFINILEKDEMEIVKICCQVLDATAFETPTKGGSSVRGIYPTAGMMNHSCIPNTRHFFNKTGEMIVETTKSIKKGEEFSTNYCSLAWGTQARNAHLLATKRFTCQCFRCLDPMEFGTHLMGLYCMKKKCGGVLLPLKSISGPWACHRCQTQLPSTRVAVIQKMVATIISGLEVGNLKSASRILCTDSLVPACSYVAIEFKINLIFIYGNHVGFEWPKLRDYDLVLKKLMCIEILMLFSLLKLGFTRQRGLILKELAETMKELERRVKSMEIVQLLEQIPKYGSIEDTLNEAAMILSNDAS